MLFPYFERKTCSKGKCVTDHKILHYSWSNNCHSEYHQDPGDDIDGIQSVAGTEGEQGWRSGESTRLPPMWLGFSSWTRRHDTWGEFVAGSCPCSEGFFFGYSGFPLSSKTNTSKFNSIWNLRTTGLSVVKTI